jgi:hypothetical protein
MAVNRPFRDFSLHSDAFGPIILGIGVPCRMPEAVSGRATEKEVAAKQMGEDHEKGNTHNWLHVIGGPLPGRDNHRR